MQYAILIYETEAQREVHAKGGAPQEKITAEYMAYSRALVAADKMRGGEGLELPRFATTVVGNGTDNPRIQDGPFADTKEQLAGFYIIEVKDLDEAIDWAKKCPGAREGKVEIRPTLKM